MNRKRKFSLNTIRKKMLFYFLMPIVLISLVSIYLSLNSSYFFKKIDLMFKSIILLEDMQANLADAEKNLTLFIQTKDSNSKNRYQRNIDLLNENMDKLQNTKFAGNYNIARLDNLISKFNENAEEAISAKYARDANTIREKYNNVHTAGKYVMEEMQGLNLQFLKSNTEYYITLSKNNMVSEKANLIMIIDILVLSFIIILYTTYKMTDPIVRLSFAAEEISKGNFDSDEVIATSEDEIKVLVKAFNKMKTSVRSYIEALQSKAEIESKLMEKEMQNLKMQTLLNNAELQSLQSQINPHFLFNTLNAGVQLAMIEDADKTSYFLENLAAVFRYNVRRPDTEVTLKDEINNIRAYIDLMKVRFGDMITFSEQIEDEALLKYIMPPLILQPVIENSCIHGIGEKEEGGNISVHVYKENNHVIIAIADNGVGMEDETIGEILRKASRERFTIEKPIKGHTTGIGISNVIQRLRLYFKYEDVISITSVRCEGTRVVVRIPEIKEDEYVQAYDCR